MPSGLVALLDDISVIAKMAASSIDDVGVSVGKAGAKAAGVVIDDAAVTPSYVTEFTPDRELPIIWTIAKGSLFNKLVILLPAALVLSQFLPWAITPLLMVGALYLCFEGAEKLIEKLGGEKHGSTIGDPITDIAAFERERTSGAIRTDFILSAEIMAIALAEVASLALPQRALVLALVAVAITAMVYGAVALIVKMDDVGLHLAKRGDTASQQIGRSLLHAMPILLTGLSGIGTAAMLWVGGGIILHGSHDLGLHAPQAVVDAARHAAEAIGGTFGSVLGWLVSALLAGLVGVALGAIAAWIVHVVQKRFALGKGAN